MGLIIIILSFFILYWVIYKAVKDAINDSILGKRVSTDIELELQQTMKDNKSE